jgi:hypothetical protein
MFASIFGLIFVIGCGSSVEKQAMTEFLQQYSKFVDDYSSADASVKAEIEGKLTSYESKWSDMKIDMGSLVTPQVLDELDNEYKKITQRYASLAKKS